MYNGYIFGGGPSHTILSRPVPNQTAPSGEARSDGSPRDGDGEAEPKAAQCLSRRLGRLTETESEVSEGPRDGRSRQVCRPRGPRLVGRPRPAVRDRVEPGSF